MNEHLEAELRQHLPGAVEHHKQLRATENGYDKMSVAQLRHLLAIREAAGYLPEGQQAPLTHSTDVADVVGNCSAVIALIAEGLAVGEEFPELSPQAVAGLYFILFSVRVSLDQVTAWSSVCRDAWAQVSEPVSMRRADVECPQSDAESKAGGDA